MRTFIRHQWYRFEQLNTQHEKIIKKTARHHERYNETRMKCIDNGNIISGIPEKLAAFLLDELVGLLIRADIR